MIEPAAATKSLRCCVEILVTFRVDLWQVPVPLRRGG